MDCVCGRWWLSSVGCLRPTNLTRTIFDSCKTQALTATYFRYAFIYLNINKFYLVAVVTFGLQFVFGLWWCLDHEPSRADHTRVDWKINTIFNVFISRRRWVGKKADWRRRVADLECTVIATSTELAESYVRTERDWVVVVFGDAKCDTLSAPNECLMLYLVGVCACWSDNSPLASTSPSSFVACLITACERARSSALCPTLGVARFGSDTVWRPASKPTNNDDPHII